MKLWSLLALPFVAGCSVSTLESADGATPTRNECSSDADCGTGSCQAPGMCRAASGSFSTVLFEVTPPTSARTNGGVQYLKRIDQLSLYGGEQNIALAQLAHLEGRIVPTISFNAATGAACDPSTLAFEVVITPSDRLLGLGVSSYPAKPTATGEADKSHVFSLDLPAAEYDIYLQPRTQPYGGLGCELAPQLYRRQVIPEGNVNVPLILPAPSWLELRVSWPAAQGLEGWRADVIDPETRTVLSNEAVLSLREGDEYVAALAYSPVVGSKIAEARELLRLRPPEGQAAPTILLERSGLELTTPGIARVDQLTGLPPVIEVKGQVLVSNSPEAVAGANVIVSATKLDTPGIEAGVPAEYFQEATADENGYFNVKLLPGTYRCVAVPPGGLKYATGLATWEISGTSNVVAGRTVEVKPLVSLSGSVVTAGQAPVSGVSVSAAASPGSLMVDAFGSRMPVAPRAGTDILDANGLFEIGMEPGTYDLSVRPTDDTGFAWFVRPNVTVSREVPEVPLGTLSMPLPLEYSGVVTAAADGKAAEPVAGALIRAYVYVTPEYAYVADPGKAASVLQIGETRAGDGGRFQLFLPANLD